MTSKKLNLTPLYVMLISLTALVVASFAAKSAGIAFNVSESMPDITYRVGHGEKGSVVSFCTPIPHPALLRGTCPDSSMPLLKRVAGVAGDVVRTTDAGTKINGVFIVNSRPLDLDSSGKALPHLRGEFRLKKGEIWAAGEHSNSFDSRYFGPVTITLLR